jgi:hypothetical protein
MKLYWKVAPKPTGRYRSFESRAWPTPYYDKELNKPAAFLVCDDDYTPSLVVAGRHAPLTIIVLHHQHPDGGASWKRFRLKKTAATLDEAKKMVLEFVQSHADWHPKDKQT